MMENTNKKFENNEKINEYKIAENINKNEKESD